MTMTNHNKMWNAVVRVVDTYAREHIDGGVFVEVSTGVRERNTISTATESVVWDEIARLVVQGWLDVAAVCR
jgi:hypothetical protein